MGAELIEKDVGRNCWVGCILDFSAEKVGKKV